MVSTKFKVFTTFYILACYGIFGWFIIPTLIPIGKIIIARVLIAGTIVTLAYNWWDEIKKLFKRKPVQQ